MAQITRYDGNMKPFAQDALGTERTVFGDTTQSDALDDNINTDFFRGWGIVGVNELPTKQDFNALAFTTTALSSYLYQRGIPEYQAAQEFFEGSITFEDGLLYKAVQDTTGDLPSDDDGTNWNEFLGVTVYDAVTTYHTDSIVLKRGTSEIYQSIGDGNVGNALPDKEDDANWSYVGDLSTLTESASLFNYKSGLILANNSTDSEHDLDIGAGVCSDTTNAVSIDILSALTKRADASWVAGNNQGGMSSSLSISSNTWYHVFAIVVGGVADVGFDTDVDATNLIADHTVTAYRRIGSFLTDGSSNILPFTQIGNYVYWTNPPLDANTTVGTTTTTLTLSIPPDVYVMAMVSVYQTGQSSLGYLFPTFVTAQTPSSGGSPSGCYGGTEGGNMHVMGDTSSQINARASSTETLRLSTLGYIENFNN